MGKIPDQIQAYISKGDVAFRRSTPESFNSALDSYLEAAFYIAEKKWHIPIRQKIRSVLTADINNDGKDEVLFGTEGNLLYAYESDCARGHDTPSLFWQKPFQAKDWVNGISVIDLDGDGQNEIIVAADRIYILNAQGHSIREHPSEYPISSLQTYSNENGTKMIVVGDNNGNIKCYDYDFSELWPLQFKKSDNMIVDLAIGDFDGDGRIEVAAASEDKFVYIIDDTGEEKDKIDVKHWIVNMADCKMKNDKLRLFIGKFTGDTLVYKHKQTSQAVSLKQSGILDLKVEYIFDDANNPQFIVGSSDRCLSIFDYSGEPLWIFESGLGQRAISVKTLGNGKLDLFVGTESGDVFRYSVNLVKELVSKIKEAHNNVRTSDLLDLNLSPEKLDILRNYIEYNPINQDASLEKAQTLSINDFNKAIVAGMEVWFNNCSFLWAFPTQGRVYDLAPYPSERGHGLLVGSDDGFLYCVNQDGEKEWFFNSRNDLRGLKQGIRGVFCDAEDGDIYTASVDKSLYSLNKNGKPLWNFCHEDWVLFTNAGRFTETQSKNIFAGTEDGYVLAFDKSGILLWKTRLGKRIRALSFCDDYEGHSYVIAGCDDNKIYIIGSDGTVFCDFPTPHYVLVVHVADIDNDGETEILTGNEDGHLHAYNFNGQLLWRFETESWVAALDVFKNENGDTEIFIGSQDNHVYVLNQHGALLWQYETNARVRTISANGKLSRIAFGSYDKKAYMLEQVDRKKSIAFLRQLYIDNLQTPIVKETEKVQKILEDPIRNRHKRAFVYLFTQNPELLKSGLKDKSDIVIAAIGSNLVENFLTQNMLEDVLIDLLVDSNRRVKAVVLCKLTQLMSEGKIKKRIVSNVIHSVIAATSQTSSKIDVFRYWIAMTNNCDDILRMVENLFLKDNQPIDEFLVDELNRAGVVALKTNTNDSGDYNIIDIVKKMSALIEYKYPDTARQLRADFL
jgi:outer membrane protein assembly factor BamB